MLYKSSKVSTGVGSAASSLYDFGSIKQQVENRTKAVFMKKNAFSKGNAVIPVYTPQQIINSLSGQMESEKSMKNENSQKVIPQV